VPSDAGSIPAASTISIPEPVTRPIRTMGAAGSAREMPPHSGREALGLAASVRDRYRAAQEQVLEAAARAGRRDGDDILIVAVTKGFGAEAVVAAASAGIAAVGENRVQEAQAKKPAATEALSAIALASAPHSPRLQWHLIGHLQSNKARHVLGLFDWVQSVDSLDIARELSRRAEPQGLRLPVLVEIKTAPEATKHGILPPEAPDLVPAIAALPGLEVRGLMTVGPIAEPARPAFRTLAALRTALAPGLALPLQHLSMGMSGDFETAVEEGATIVRLGTALFGPRG